MATSLPSYVRASPVGYHITDLRAFVSSPNVAPVSIDEARADWATPEAAQQVGAVFPHDAAGIAAANIFVYNKSRDVDRICPSCRRWYRVGESPHTYDSFESFLVREGPSAPSDPARDAIAIAIDQDLSGICLRVCWRVMNNDQRDGMMGSSIEHVTEGDFRSLNGDMAEREGWVTIRTTPEEEEATGAKIIWYKPDHLKTRAGGAAGQM